jgi:hypothetical protein
LSKKYRPAGIFYFRGISGRPTGFHASAQSIDVKT